MAKKYALTLQAQLKNTKSIEQEILAVKKKWEREGLTNIKIKVDSADGATKKMTASAKDLAGGTRRATAAINQFNGELKTTETVTTGVAKATKKAGKSTNYFESGLLGAAKTAVQYALGLGLIYKAMAEIGKGTQYIKDLDKEMRDVQIVAGYTDEQIKDLAVDYNLLAEAMGATTLEVASGSLEWTRQGKSIAETQELLRSTLMLSKLGNVETAESTEYLTSILNGFKLEAKDTEGVVDKLVAVDNAAATSVKELATALQKSSVSAQAAGVDFDTLVAYIGTVSSVTRLSAETVGTSFKTMFARFQDIKTGAIDGEGAINNVEAALGRLTLASGEQMSILDRQTGEFKDFTVVIEQLAGQWDDLSQMEQANIVKAFAGVRQRESFLALMENQVMMHQLLAEEMESEGLAAERYETYLEGLEAAQNKSTAAWEGMIAATIDGGLVKWFYDAQAGLFGFIKEMGGLDVLVPAIIAGFLAWSVASGVLATALAAVSLPAVAIGAVVLALTVGITKLTGAIEENSDEIVKKWSDSLDVIVKKTDSSAASVKYFADEMERLDDLSWIEQLKIDKDAIVAEDFENILGIIKDTSKSWDEYSQMVGKAADAAGYLKDGNGRFYKEIFTGGKWVKNYADEIGALSEEMYIADMVTDSWAGRLESLTNDTDSAASSTIALADSFQKFIASAYGALEEPTEEQERFMGNMITLNDMFLSGAMNAETYFSQMGAGFEEINMSAFFGEDQEGAELFITGAVTNAIAGIQQLTEEFNDPENTEGLAEYSQGLVEWAGMFTDMADMLDDVTGFENVSDSIGGLTDGMNELSQANEAMVLSQQLLMELENESLMFGTEVFNEKMELYSQSLAQSGQVYTDTMGNVLSSQQEIYGYLVSGAGNAQLLMGQVATQGGSSIDKMKFSAGQMLVEIGKAISNFDAKIDFSATQTGMMDIVPAGSWLANQINGGMGIGIPSFTYSVGGNAGAGVVSMGESLMESAGGVKTEHQGNAVPTWNLPTGGSGEWNIEALGLNGAEEALKTLEGTVGSLSNAFKKLKETSGKTTSELEEDAKSIDALLKMVVAKLKQEANAKKDALKEELAGYKKIIDKRKELLDSMEEERKYQKERDEKQKSLASIQSEIEELRLDDSEEAKARRRALEEEALKLQEEIEEDSRERSIDKQKKALDDEFDRFKRQIDRKIARIDKFLSQNGKIVAKALALIGAKNKGFYEELARWNAKYGSGIRADVTAAWEEAYQAIMKYKGGLAAITGNPIPIPTPSYSSGGAYSDLNIPSGMGSYQAVSSVLSEGLGSKNLTPDFSSRNDKTDTTGGSGLSFEKFMEVNVSGNLDESTIPKIESIVDRAIAKLNESMRNRGYGQRDAGKYSI